MSAPQVLTQLQAWERGLAVRDETLVARLRPGLSEQEVRDACAPYGLVPTRDVIALWGWHDGDRADLAEDWGRPSVLPNDGLFLSLAASLERSRDLQRITMDGDDDGDYSWEEELSAREGHDVQVFFRRAYLIFCDTQYPTYLDCSDPEAIDTPTCTYNVEDPDRSLRPALADRLAFWNRALRAGVWPAPREWDVDHQAAVRAGLDDTPRWEEWLL